MPTRGFTLIELMATVAVIAITLTVGVPSLQQLIASNRLSTETNDLLGTLLFSRSEAVKRAVDVLVCASDYSVALGDATKACSDAWQQGMLVFVDTNHNHQFDPGADIGLRVIEGPRSSLTVYVLRSGPGTSETNVLGYNSMGFTSFQNSKQRGFDLVLCDSIQHQKRTLSINRVGRLVTTKGTC